MIAEMDQPRIFGCMKTTHLAEGVEYLIEVYEYLAFTHFGSVLD